MINLLKVMIDHAANVGALRKVHFASWNNGKDVPFGDKANRLTVWFRADGRVEWPIEYKECFGVTDGRPISYKKVISNA
jgi:hypothetical protein